MGSAGNPRRPPEFSTAAGRPLGPPAFPHAHACGASRAPAAWTYGKPGGRSRRCPEGGRAAPPSGSLPGRPRGGRGPLCVSWRPRGGHRRRPRAHARSARAVPSRVPARPCARPPSRLNPLTTSPQISPPARLAGMPARPAGPRLREGADPLRPACGSANNGCDARQ